MLLHLLKPLLIRGLSIICIHDLGGHRERTWETTKESSTEQSVLWPRDLLPRCIPHARVMTFGYDSEVPSVRYLMQRIMYSKSKIMLSHLKEARNTKEATHRPIIFLAHGLGGLIVKSALIHADREEQRFSGFKLSTAGVLLFGTPHQGTSNTPWRQLMSDIVRRHIDLDGTRDTLDAYLGWLQYKPLCTSFQTFCFCEDDSGNLASDASQVRSFMVLYMYMSLTVLGHRRPTCSCLSVVCSPQRTVA